MLTGLLGGADGDSRRSARTLGKADAERCGPSDLLTCEFFLSQQALENSGLSSLPAAAHPSDTSHAKTAVPGQDPDLRNTPSEPADPADAGPEKEPESPEKLDRKEKKLIKKKSPFLPGNLSGLWSLDVQVAQCLFLEKTTFSFFPSGGDGFSNILIKST